MSCGEQREALLDELGYRLILAIKSGKTKPTELVALSDKVLQLANVLECIEREENIKW